MAEHVNRAHRNLAGGKDVLLYVYVHIYVHTYAYMYTSRRPPPVSPRPPSCSFRDPAVGRASERTGETPVLVHQRACVCSARRGCHPCGSISIYLSIYMSLTFTQIAEHVNRAHRNLAKGIDVLLYVYVHIYEHIYAYIYIYLSLFPYISYIYIDG